MQWGNWLLYSLYKVIPMTVELIIGSIAVYSTRFIDPAWGFAMAWNYAICWLVIFPFELLCGAYAMSYWVPPETVPLCVWILIFYVLIIGINMFGVLGYG